MRIFLNTHGKDEKNISPELKELLEFMEHTNETGREFHSEKIKSLRKSAQTIQANEEMGVRYMQATTGWSAEEAMDKMQVSERDREAVRPLL